MRVAPQCNVCDRPAKLVSWSQEYSNYCGGLKCTNINRVCTGCGQSFIAGKEGAGSKRCSPCRQHPDNSKIVLCAWCGCRASGSRRRKATWPVICADCLKPLAHVVNRLKDHHVPHERGKKLIESPGCDICGQNLLQQHRDTTKGTLRAQLTVDHDHSCCPGQFSCGRCIRGFLCFGCNVAVGMVKNRPEYALALHRYLEAWVPPTGIEPVTLGLGCRSSIH